MRAGRELLRLLATLHGWGSFAASCAVWALLVVPLALLLAPIWPGVRDRFRDATRAVLRLYLRGLPFARFVVQGGEHRLDGARIVVANHQSRLDPIVMLALEPRLSGPARNYLFRVPALGAILRMAGFFPSDIGEMAKLEELHRSARETRDRGGALLFFPEGTRSRSGEIGPFHRGAFRAAYDHGLPIQPVVIEGLHDLLPPDHWVVQTHGRHPVRIRYLPPLVPPFGPGVRRDVVRGMAEQVRGALVEELAKLRAERGEAGR